MEQATFNGYIHELVKMYRQLKNFDKTSDAFKYVSKCRRRAITELWKTSGAINLKIKWLVYCLFPEVNTVVASIKHKKDNRSKK